MPGTSEDLFRLTFAKRMEGPKGVHWILSFALIQVPSSIRATVDKRLVVTVTDETYREFSGQAPIATHDQILGMEVQV